jgi:hypothetical protein
MGGSFSCRARAVGRPHYWAAGPLLQRETRGSSGRDEETVDKLRATAYRGGMRTLYLLPMCWGLAAPSTGAEVGPDSVDVFLLAGQSNMPSGRVRTGDRVRAGPPAEPRRSSDLSDQVLPKRPAAPPRLRRRSLGRERSGTGSRHLLRRQVPRRPPSREALRSHAAALPKWPFATTRGWQAARRTGRHLDAGRAGLQA